eukprot:COSAG02_NODE_5494_length_4283_cov_8.585325_2_plen_392_part_00
MKCCAKPAGQRRAESPAVSPASKSHTNAGSAAAKTTATAPTNELANRQNFSKRGDTTAATVATTEGELTDPSSKISAPVPEPEPELEPEPEPNEVATADKACPGSEEGVPSARPGHNVVLDSVYGNVKRKETSRPFAEANAGLQESDVSTPPGREKVKATLAADLPPGTDEAVAHTSASVSQLDAGAGEQRQVAVANSTKERTQQAQAPDSSEASERRTSPDRDVQKASTMEQWVNHTELAEELREAAAANETLRSENTHLQTQLETMDLLYLHAKKLVKGGSAGAPTSGDSARTIDPGLDDAVVKLQTTGSPEAREAREATEKHTLATYDAQEASTMEQWADHTELAGELREAAAANETLRSENAHLRAQLKTMDLLYLHAMDFIKNDNP